MIQVRVRSELWAARGIRYICLISTAMYNVLCRSIIMFSTCLPLICSRYFPAYWSREIINRKANLPEHLLIQHSSAFVVCNVPPDFLSDTFLYHRKISSKKIALIPYISVKNSIWSSISISLKIHELGTGTRMCACRHMLRLKSKLTMLSYAKNTYLHCSWLVPPINIAYFMILPKTVYPFHRNLQTEAKLRVTFVSKVAIILQDRMK